MQPTDRHPIEANASATLFASRYTCRMRTFHPSCNKHLILLIKLLPLLLPMLCPSRFFTTARESICNSTFIDPFRRARHNPSYTPHNSAMKAFVAPIFF
ncbi:heat shock 70 kDa protein [Trifolium repens]|nr:heat shock 70 kDa protein [Trifolium repens]